MYQFPARTQIGSNYRTLPGIGLENAFAQGLIGQRRQDRETRSRDPTFEVLAGQVPGELYIRQAQRAGQPLEFRRLGSVAGDLQPELGQGLQGVKQMVNTFFGRQTAEVEDGSVNRGGWRGRG